MPGGRTPHYNRPGGVESGDADGLGAAVEAVLVHRARLPGGRQGRQPAQRLRRPEEFGERAAVFLARRRATICMQRRYLRGVHLEPSIRTIRNYVAGANPISAVYGGPMVERRPHPRLLLGCAALSGLSRPHSMCGAMGPTGALGHWLNGRLCRRRRWTKLSRRCSTTTASIADRSPAMLGGTVPGFVIDRVMSAREALQPLELAYFFDAVESDGAMPFRPRGARRADRCRSRRMIWSRTRAERRAHDADARAGDRPAGLGQDQLHRRSSGDYQPAVAEARRHRGATRPRRRRPSCRSSWTQLTAAACARVLAVREPGPRASGRASTLPPSRLALEPGDIVIADRRAGSGGCSASTEIGDHGARDIEARSIDPDIYLGSPRRRARAGGRPAAMSIVGQPLRRVPRPAAAARRRAAIGRLCRRTPDPWPGGVAIYCSPESYGFHSCAGDRRARATMGVTFDGDGGRDRSALRPRHAAARGGRARRNLSRISLLQCLAGAQSWRRVRTPTANGRSFQFPVGHADRRRVPTSCRGFCAGRRGSEHAMRAPLAAGARFVLHRRRRWCG